MNPEKITAESIAETENAYAMCKRVAAPLVAEIYECKFPAGWHHVIEELLKDLLELKSNRLKSHIYKKLILRFTTVSQALTG